MSCVRQPAWCAGVYMRDFGASATTRTLFIFGKLWTDVGDVDEFGVNRETRRTPTREPREAGLPSTQRGRHARHPLEHRSIHGIFSDLKPSRFYGFRLHSSRADTGGLRHHAHPRAATLLYDRSHFPHHTTATPTTLLTRSCSLKDPCCRARTRWACRCRPSCCGTRARERSRRSSFPGGRRQWQLAERRKWRRRRSRLRRRRT